MHPTVVRFLGLRQLPVVISLPSMRRLSEHAASAKCDAPDGLTPGGRLGFQIDFEVVVPEHGICFS